MLNPQFSRVGREFEALLLEPLVEPLEHALGEYGGIVANEFTKILAGALEQRRG